MIRILRLLGQAVVYFGTALLLGYFSNTPSYTHFPPNKAALTINIVHSAARRESCRPLTAEELAKLAPNMRKPQVCERERLSVRIEMTLDGRTLVAQDLAPTGLSGDGPAKLDRRFALAPGTYRLELRMRDSARDAGYDYELTRDITLGPQENLVIDFRPEAGGFILL